jgi:hypothetical protein
VVVALLALLESELSLPFLLEPRFLLVDVDLAISVVIGVLSNHARAGVVEVDGGDIVLASRRSESRILALRVGALNASGTIDNFGLDLDATPAAVPRRLHDWLLETLHEGVGPSWWRNFWARWG